MADQTKNHDGLYYPLGLLWGNLLNCDEQSVYFVQEPSGLYSLVSENAAIMLGTRRELLQGRCDWQVFPNSHSDLERAHNWAVENKRSLIDELVRVEVSHIEPRWLVLMKLPAFAPNGDLIALVGTFRRVDVSRETALHLSNIAGVIRYLRDNMAIPHTLHSLAELADLAPEILDRKINQVFRRSLRDILCTQRLAYARDLLKRTSHSISHIAETVGYTSQSAFARQFRLHVGVTPTEYREAQYLLDL